MPPNEGYGPTDAGYSGHIDPFSAAFDNRIRYNDMIRRQMISQFQQNTVRPSTMTLSQQRNIATDPRFQYGVPGGQDPRQYQRQAEMSRSAFGSAITETAMDIGLWQSVSGVSSLALGASKFIAPIGIPLAATLAAGYFVNKGVQNALQRQQYMHSMAGDIEQYRGRLGFNEPLSYGQATTLGKSLTGMAYERANGGYFSTDQIARIHKIGLSNDMLSAKGGSTGNRGTMRQYEQNVRDLTDTTEEVVKLLQTTIEGGMSVIKELQNTGFGSMKQVKQQIRQAKSFGGITGLGAQNMMQIGAAGARSVQGTPWDAAVGASMYQTGAASASHLANLGPAGAYAVRRAGGVAAAGGAIGRFQMNVLSSGMGTKAVAYAMKADGTIDNARMGQLLSGNVSAYDMVQGANERGYNMGISGRVQFERNKADLLNNMNDLGRSQMTNQIFKAWGSNRYGSLDAKAWVFAGQFTNNQRDQRLMWQKMMNPQGFDVQWGANRATEAGLMDIDVRRARYTGPTAKAFGAVTGGAGGFFNKLGSNIVYESGRAMTSATSVVKDIKQSLIGGAYETGMMMLGIAGPDGIYNRAKYGDASAAIRANYSIGMQPPQRGIAALEQMSGAQIRGLRNVPKVDSGVDWLEFTRKKSQKDLKYFYQQINNAQFNGTANTLVDDPTIVNMLGGSGSKAVKHLRDTPIGFVNSATIALNKASKSVNAQKNEAMSAWEVAWQKADTPERKAMDQKLYRAKILVAAMPDITSQYIGGGSHVGRLAAAIGNRTGVDVTGAGWGPAIERAMGESASSRLDMGPMFGTNEIDIKRHAQQADKSMANFIGYEEQDVTKISRYGGRGGKYNTTERVQTSGSRAKMRAYRNIISKYTKLKTGDSEEIRFNTMAERRRSWDLMESLITETGEGYQGLKGKIAQQVSNKKDVTGAWFGSDEGYAAVEAIKKSYTTGEAAKALQVRDGQAKRFIGYLEGGLRAKVSDKQSSFIRGIMTYQTSDEDIKAMASGGGPAGILELLSSGMGLAGGEEAVREMARDPSMFRSKLSGSYAAKSKQEKSALELASERLANYRFQESQLEKSPLSGKKRETKEKEVYTNMQRAQLEYDTLIQKQSQPTSDRSATSYANVQPPILNYWNNRWTL